MIAGPAEWKRQTQARHARQYGFEQGGIFGGELAIKEGRGTRSLVFAANAQRGLKARHLARSIASEPRGCLSELKGVGVVFRIIDREKIAGDVGQGTVQSARLGMRLAWRCDEDVQPVRPGCFQRRLYGVVIVCFQHQEALQFVGGVVDLAQAFDQLIHNLRLVIQGGQNGVAGPGSGLDGRFGRSCAGDNQDQPPHRHAQECNGRDNDEKRSGDVRGRIKCRDQC